TPVLDESGAPRELILDGQSSYAFEELDPGNYEIVVERDGYTLDLVQQDKPFTFTIVTGTREEVRPVFRPLAVVRFKVLGELFSGDSTYLDDEQVTVTV